VVHYRNYEIAYHASSNLLTAVTRAFLDLFDKRDINILYEQNHIAYKYDKDLRNLIKKGSTTIIPTRYV